MLLPGDGLNTLVALSCKIAVALRHSVHLLYMGIVRPILAVIGLPSGSNAQCYFAKPHGYPVPALLKNTTLDWASNNHPTHFFPFHLASAISSNYFAISGRLKESSLTFQNAGSGKSVTYPSPRSVGKSCDPRVCCAVRVTSRFIML